MSKITIKKKDVIPYVYFVSSMAQQTKNGMFGSLSSKSDLIGGIFDRWINIIPESVSFNQYFLPKAEELSGVDAEAKVFSDFYMYDPKEVGIAPDVIGLKIGEKIVPFVKYDDSQEKKAFWVPQKDCPQIEVKSFFGNKYMVSLRDQNYSDKFLVFINAKIDVDYLLGFFNSEIFSCSEISKLEMPECFIERNAHKMISQTKPVDFEKDVLGTIEILCVTTGASFMDIAMRLDKGQTPRYFKSITEKSKTIPVHKYKHKFLLSECCDVKISNLYRFNDKWYKIFSAFGEKTLDVMIENPNGVLVINNTKEAIDVLILEDAKFNNIPLKKGRQYRIEFGTFGAIKGEEYFLNKIVADNLDVLNSKEKEMLNSLAEIIKNNAEK